MSFTSYCQGLQSCLETACLVEPRVLRLKMDATPKSGASRSSSAARKPFDCESKISNINYVGGWSFLQSLANNTSQTTENDTVYIPPSVKRSSSTLCTKRLEMCSERLGSETGSDAGESSDGMTLLSSDNAACKSRDGSKLRETDRTKPSASFPPPLTSITGSTTVEVKPHREGGRLVLKAVTVSCPGYFHVERKDGRLRLHLTRDCSHMCGGGGVESEVEAEDGEVDTVAAEDDCRGEELEGNSENAGSEMGLEALPRPIRCKEAGGSGQKGLLKCVIGF